MRRAPLLCGIAALLCAAAAPAPTWADRSFELALVRPTVDNYGMLAVERAQTPRQWEFGFSATLGYAHNPLRVSLRDPGAATTSPHDLVRDQLTLDIGASLGLWDYLTLAAALPIAAQWYDAAVLGDPAAPLATPQPMSPPVPTTSTGLLAGQPRQNLGPVGAGPRDPRLALKARLPRLRALGLGIILGLTLPLGNASSFMGERGATFRPVLVSDLALLNGRLSLAANLGFIVRAESTLVDAGPPQAVVLSVGHELTWAVGATVRLQRLLALGLEALGTASIDGADNQSTADLLGAAYLHPSDRLRICLGVGGGVIPGPRRDDVRALLSLAWTPAPGGGAP